jgi:hypothetical protein
MSMITIRAVLATLPATTIEPHPMAVEGTLYDFKRANDKTKNGNIYHYAQRGQLFWCRSEASDRIYKDNKVFAKK